METVLVTGCNGFLGQNIVHGLAAAGFEVLGLDRQPVSPCLDDAHYCTADISADNVHEDILAKFPACGSVVHAAASLSQQPHVLSVNVGGTWQVLEYARRAGCGRFIYISSVPVIGTPLSDPITEAHPVAPATLYHASKYFGEQLLNIPLFMSLDSVIFRIPSPIGAGMPAGRVVPVFLQSGLDGRPITLMGKGGRVQNYIDTGDIVYAIQLALQQKQHRGLFLLGGHSLSNVALAELCLRLTDSKASIRYSGEPDAEEHLHWNINYGKAECTFGYTPRTPLENTLSAVMAGLTPGTEPL